MAKSKKQKKASKKTKSLPKNLPQNSDLKKQAPAESHSVQAKNELSQIVAILSAVGMLLSGYLALSEWINQTPVLCSEGSSCDIVQQSRWGTFLSLPIAFWGFLTYAILFYVSIKIPEIKKRWKAIWTVSLLAWSYSLYLISVSVWVISAVCFYCIASFVILSAVFGVSTFKRPKQSERFNFAQFAKPSLLIALLFVGGMDLHYSGFFDPKAGPEDPYLRGLAQHLEQNNYVVYGAFW